VSWRALLQRLDDPHDVKRAVYRGHRIAGLALFAGGLYAFDRLWFVYEPGTIARIVRSWGQGELGVVLVESAWLFLLAGNAAAVVAALVVVFRPSLLKGLERWTDRIYRTRNTS